MTKELTKEGFYNFSFGILLIFIGLLVKTGKEILEGIGLAVIILSLIIFTKDVEEPEGGLEIKKEVE